MNVFKTPFGNLLLFAMGGSQQTEETETGNPVSFQTNLVKPMRSLVANFIPKQAGSGDPSPENVRPISPWTGFKIEHFDKNLLTINRNTSQFTQGITYKE